MGKWIDLQDKISGAKLKIAEMEGSQYLFIVGLSNASPNWLCAQQKLGFNSGGAGRFLVRKVQQGERIAPTQYHSVWPFARIAEMDPSQFLLDLSSSKKRSQRDADDSQGQGQGQGQDDGISPDEAMKATRPRQGG